MSRWMWFVLLMFIIGVASPAIGTQIEGGAERRGFEPADQVLLQTDLSHCPVGETPQEALVSRGGYECARFRDRIWLHPTATGTVVWVPFPAPLKGDFSLEFPVWLADEGCAFVEFRLHSDSHPDDWESNPYAYINDALAGGHLACSREASGFGSMDRPGRPRMDLHTRLSSNAIHHIVVQVRRDQIRFYVDGKRIGMKPFRPIRPVIGMSLYFARHYGTAKAYAEAPALVGDIRLATYSQAEALPEAEKDLIRDLGAVQTPEGLKITLSEAILFDFGKWSLKPGADKTLDRLAKLARLRDGIIRVEGHTDNVGTAAYNRVLSELRAYVVSMALARRGVDARRLQPRGFGSTRPVVPNDTEANRARNRRVEVILLNGK